MNLKYKIIIKFILFSFFLRFIFTFNNNIYSDSNYNIVESNYYHKFNEIKARFYNDLFFKTYLKEIKIIFYIYIKNLISNKNLTNIHISMSLNENYFYPTFVSMISILINCNKSKTFLTFHLLCSPNIKPINLLKIKSFFKKYRNFEIICYNMGNNFINNTKECLSPAGCYRLLTPIFIDTNWLLHLDGDTLTLKDLSELYQNEFSDYYVLGFLDYSKDLRINETRNEKYINSGVIFLNLDKIRNDKMVYDLINIINNKTKLEKHDQTAINYVFYPKIGLLPLKYGIWNFPNKIDIINYTKKVKQKLNITQLEEALKDPVIIHNVRGAPKIWKKIFKDNYMKVNNTIIKNDFQKYYKLWHYYAKKTEYYDEMKKIF